MMPKVIDAFGEYVPTLNKCGCIDIRTLNNIDHSLRIIYSDKSSERARLKEEKKDTTESDLIIKRTEGLQDIIRSIDSCEHKIKDQKLIYQLPKCVCKYPMKRISEISQNLLDDIEIYKDITFGKFREITPMDIMERIEEKTKDIITQRREYERCCGGNK